MKKGDLYLKHVRGSRYAFNYGKLFYKYPNGGKNYAIGDFSDLFEDLCTVKQSQNGRVIINENQEIVVYRKLDNDQVWMPYYIGRLENEIKFEGIDNNPNNIKPGLLWTGFASHHGAKFQLNLNDRVYFKEIYYEEGAQTIKKYFVKNVDVNLIESLYYFKQGSGSFHINEYGHIWAPVDREVINNCYNTDIIKVSEIETQFKKMTNIQKRTIQKYSEQRYSKLTKKDESWYPIYIGKYPLELEITREERPHTIVNPDYIF